MPSTLDEETTGVCSDPAPLLGGVSSVGSNGEGFQMFGSRCAAQVSSRAPAEFVRSCASTLIGTVRSKTAELQALMSGYLRPIRYQRRVRLHPELLAQRRGDTEYQHVDQTLSYGPDGVAQLRQQATNASVRK